MFPRVTSIVVVLAVLALVVAAPAVRADEANDQYAVAAGHYARENWKLAADEFQAFLKIYPTDAKADQGVFFLAGALLQSGRLEEAEKQFADYLRRAPEGPYARAARYRVGEAAYLGKRFEQARKDLESFRRTYPGDQLDAYVLPYLGDIALARNDPAVAADCFGEALRRFPQSAMQDDCRLGLGRALKELGKPDEAGRYYQALAAKRGSPLADDARFRLGVLECDSGAYAEAVATLAPFETELARSPLQSRARLARALALEKLGKLDEARLLLEKIVADAEVGVEAGNRIGMIQKRQEHWDAASRTLLAAAEKHSRHKLAQAMRFHAGDAMLRAGRAAEATAQFDRVLASVEGDDSWRDDAARGKIQAAMQAKDYPTVDREAAAFSKQFPESPLRTDVERLLGRSLVARRQYAPAVMALEPLVREKATEPETLEDRYLLALAYEGCLRYDDALAVLPPVLAGGEERLKAAARLTQASLLMALKRFPDAVEPLEQFLATQSTGERAVKAKAQLAVCLARSGRIENAKKLHGALLEEQATDAVFAPAVEQLAEAAYAAGDFVWSAELFAWLVDQSNRAEFAPQGLSGLGWSQFKRGQLAEAAATFERLLHKNPDAKLAAETACVRGRILQRLNQPDGALAMYDLILDRYPDPKSRPFAEALLAAARLRDELEQDQQAAGLYQRLVKVYPKHAELDSVLYEWSWVLSDLGRDDEAAARLNRIHQEFPKSEYWADATYRLAQRAMDAKDHAMANKLTDAILAKGPKPGIGQHTLCLQWQIAAVDKKWNDVRRAAERLIKDYPDSRLRLVADFWIAEAIYRQGDYDAAGTRFESLMQRRRGHDESWMAMIPLRRAQVLAQKKKWIEAQAIASKIATEYPNFEQQYEVDYVLGRCLAARADFQAAREAYRNVIRSKQGAKTETAAMAQWMIGETYFHQKNYDSALREYLRVEILYAYPRWQAGALLQAGKCREQLGEWKAARRVVLPAGASLSRNVVRRRSHSPVARRRATFRFKSGFTGGKQ